VLAAGLILFLVLVTFLFFNEKHTELAAHFFPAVIFKLICGIGVGILYFYYYGNGDTIQFTFSSISAPILQ
jgi:hypothetical protein